MKGLVLPLVIGAVLLAVGIAAVWNALYVVGMAARVWPRSIGRSDAELFASSEFLVRFVGLLVALVGLGVLLFKAVRG